MPQKTYSNHLNLSDAARLAGISRSTIIRHIDQGKVSVVRDKKGNRVIYASELIRAYPDASIPQPSPPQQLELNGLDDARQNVVGKHASSNLTGHSTGHGDGESSTITERFILRLETEIDYLKSQIIEVRRESQEREQRLVKLIGHNLLENREDRQRPPHDAGGKKSKKSKKKKKSKKGR